MCFIRFPSDNFGIYVGRVGCVVEHTKSTLLAHVSVKACEQGA